MSADEPCPREGSGSGREPAGKQGDGERRREADRRRLAEVFGEVLPESTRDDLDDPAADGPGEGDAHDAVLVRDVPPHHSP